MHDNVTLVNNVLHCWRFALSHEPGILWLLLQLYHPYLFHFEKCVLLMKGNGSQEHC